MKILNFKLQFSTLHFKFLIRKIRRNPVRAGIIIALNLILITVGIFFLQKAFRGAAASWYDTDWDYRKLITIDESKVSGSSNLTNFPVLISVTDTNLASAAQTDGDDIFFTDQYGNKLSHEIEKYTSGTGELLAWVKVPVLTATEDTTLYIYYGNADAANQEDYENVWDDNYVGVWHMAEDPSISTDGDCGGSTKEVCDSSSNNNDGDSNGSMTAGDQVPGRVNGSLDFDGANDNVNLGSATSVDNLAQGDITVSAWINPRTTGENSLGRIIEKRTTGGSSGGWIFRMNDTASITGLTVVSNNADAQSTAANNSLTLNDWNYVVFKYSNSGDKKVYLYVNGAEVSYATQTTGTGSPNTDATGNLLISDANDLPGARTFDGVIDNVRASNTLRSTDWIATEYANQNSPSTFYSFGVQEEQNNPILLYRFDEGVDNTCTGGTNDACDTFGKTENDGAFGASTAAPSWKQPEMCLNNSCLYFDGSNDTLTVTNNTSIDLNNNLASGFTIGGWVKVNTDDNLTQGTIFSKGDTYLKYRVESVTGTASVVAGADLSSSDATLTVTQAVTINRWHYVALGYTDDGDDEITVYVDGVSRGTSTNGSGAPAADTNDLIIGNASYHGFMDDFKVYDYERTAAQMKTDAIKNASARGSAASFGIEDLSILNDGMAGYWKMDETTLDSCETAGADFCDFSGNVKDATNVGVGITVPGKFNFGGSFDGSGDYVNIGDIY